MNCLSFPIQLVAAPAASAALLSAVSPAIFAEWGASVESNWPGDEREICIHAGAQHRAMMHETNLFRFHDEQ